MIQRILPLVLLVCGASLVGCGSRFSTQEATDACEELLDRINTAETDEQFNECVACFEDCGEDCRQQDTAPATFACPED